MSSLWGKVLRSTQAVAQNVMKGTPEAITKGSGSATSAKDRLAWMINSQHNALEKSQESDKIQSKVSKETKKESIHSETKSEKLTTITTPTETLCTTPKPQTEPSNLQKLYGIGPKLEKNLNASNIFTIQQLSKLADEECKNLKRNTKPIISLRKRAQAYIKNNKE